jgi:hypothetical protein
MYGNCKAYRYPWKPTNISSHNPSIMLRASWPSILNNRNKTNISSSNCIYHFSNAKMPSLTSISIIKIKGKNKSEYLCH